MWFKLSEFLLLNMQQYCKLKQLQTKTAQKANQLYKTLPKKPYPN